MNSVWYDMGIRDGNFTGVLPSRFLNAAYRFFFELYMRSHQSLEPEWKPWDFEKRDEFKFNGLRKWDMDGDERRFLLNCFSFQSVPYGSPLSQTFWESSRPEWSYETLYPTEAALIGEEIAPNPVQQLDFKKCLQRVGNFLWEKQRYKVINQMRFCTIPLQVRYRTKTYPEWTAYSQINHINATIGWQNEIQFKITIPSYWCADSVDRKIGICAKTLSENLKTALEGCYWRKTDLFVTDTVPDRESGLSELRIYGAVDLATHPDFKHYFQNWLTK